MRKLLPPLFLLSLLPAQEFEFYPKAQYDPAVPTLKSVVGFGWGERISMHAEVLSYLRALAQASPRVELVRFGETWQGRSLNYLVVGSEANMARLPQIRRGMARLSDPRGLSTADAEHLVETLPSIVWLANSVHGDEISGTDASMLIAYHLAAARDDEVAATILANSLVIIDPMENPDGRDRFVAHFRDTRGRWADADQQAAEHHQPWPGGRVNHYLFDMNRDWFAMTQLETRGRVREYLRWHPQVFVDLHEMGSNSSYYFAPPAEPYNDEITKAQHEWLEVFGRNNARWFDSMQFDYFTREVFDSYYPGYGDGWPTFQGSIGMTFEQASVRGLLVKRKDEATMVYADSVQHHFIASLATAQTAARQRKQLLHSYYEFRRDAIKEGAEAEIKEFVLVPGRDPSRVNRLAGLLMRQGIEVRRAEDDLHLQQLDDYLGNSFAQKQIPAGSFLIASAQPAKHLLFTLMTKGQEMDPDFVKRQVARHEKRLPAEMYDITAWSLPLLFDIEAYMSKSVAVGKIKVLTEVPKASGKIIGGPASVAYLLPWGTEAAARALAAMQRGDLRASVSHKAFRMQGREFSPGTIVVKVRGNPEDLHDRLSAIAEESGVEFYATDTSWVEEGVNLGSNNVKFMPRPKVALLYGRPTRASSAGAARYLLEQVYGYPVTLIDGEQIRGADLSEYNVLILPEVGATAGTLDPAAPRIKTWVRSGGTLIALGSATRWLTGDKVGLLESEREYRDSGKDDAKDDEKAEGEKAESAEAAAKPEPSQDQKEGEEKKPKTFDLHAAIQPEKELPAGTPGAILEVELDPEHWLAFGYGRTTNVLVSTRDIYKPIKLDKGRNVGVYAAQEKLVLSGYVWEESKSQFAHKAYLVNERLGRGQVVAFAADPNFRAFCDGLNLLFLNGIFFGPAQK